MVINQQQSERDEIFSWSTHQNRQERTMARMLGWDAGVSECCRLDLEVLSPRSKRQPTAHKASAN